MPISGDSPLTIHFTDTSSETPTQWAWSFAGGAPATSNEQNPTVIFTDEGSHTVTLIASNVAGGTGTTKEDIVTVLSAELEQFTLTVNAEEGGIAGIGSAYGPSSAVYDEGTVKTVVASADTDWEFNSWSGDGTGTGTNRTVTMNGNRTVTATFVDTSCFIAGTKILMFNGTEKNIENINVGDIITSYEGGSYVSGTVTEFLIHPIYDEVEVAIVDKKLIGSPDHPIFYNGTWSEIKDSSIPFILERMYVDNYYNLEVDGFTIHGSEHNYIANGCIVSGFGDNLVLNKMFHRQNIFIGNQCV
jgi:PKD repeat protein